MKWLLPAVVLFAGWTGLVRADEPVSYSRAIAPFIEEHCVACHDDGFETSKLALHNVEAMVKGGRRGAAIVPGKGSESLLVQFLNGTKQPQMPPKTSIPRDLIAVIERWINEGAKVDAPTPDQSARREEARKLEAEAFASDAPPPVTGLAFSPDGKWLASAGYREVVLTNAADGKLGRRLIGFSDQVAAVAFSADGKRLAGASGVAGRQGEVRIWDTADWREVRVLKGHADTILALAWRPKSSQLATCSLDKLVLVWDAETGQVARTIKNHADIVTTVAYSPDGARLASGSADKTAKVYDAETGRQLAALSSHNEAVLQVAFSPDSKYLATAGADRQIRTWNLEKPENPEHGFGHTGPVYALVWRPDGGSVWAGSGGKPSFLSYHRDNGNRVVNIREDTMPQDWVYAVAAAPDNQSIAAGGWDGAVTLWGLKDGARLRVFIPGREPVDHPSPSPP